MKGPCLLVLPAVLAALLRLAGMGGGVAVAQDHEARLPDLDFALQRVGEYDGRLSSRLQSGRLLVRMEGPRYEGESEIWFDGVRIRTDLRQTWKGPDGQGETEEWRTVFDGKRVVETRPPEFKWARISFPSDLTDLQNYVMMGGFSVLLGWPLAAPAYHGRSVADTIRSLGKGVLQVAGWRSLGDLSCLVLSAPTPTDPREFWLVPEKGWAVGRWQYRSNERKTVVNEAQEWMQPVEGLWLPRVALTYALDPQTGEKSGVARTEVVSSAFNNPIADDVFEIQLPEHFRTELFDTPGDVR